MYKSVCNVDILATVGPPVSFSLLMDAIEKRKSWVGVNFDEMEKMISVLTASLFHLNVITAQRNDYMAKKHDLERIARGKAEQFSV